MGEGRKTVVFLASLSPRASPSAVVSLASVSPTLHDLSLCLRGCGSLYTTVFLSLRFDAWKQKHVLQSILRNPPSPLVLFGVRTVSADITQHLQKRQSISTSVQPTVRSRCTSTCNSGPKSLRHSGLQCVSLVGWPILDKMHPHPPPPLP